jgi:RNA polymerase sigma-70 factor, ECF subfamily
VAVRVTSPTQPAGSPSGAGRTDAADATDAAPAAGAHRTAVWRYLRALGASPDEADELAQETLLAGFAQGLPADAAQARAWLRGVARHQWLRTRRWWQRRREREVAAAVEELWIAAAAHDDGEQLLTRLRECLERLQPRARHALDLHYRDGLAWRDVAPQLGMKPNGTKTLAQRARETLRQCLERHDDERSQA